MVVGNIQPANHAAADKTHAIVFPCLDCLFLVPQPKIIAMTMTMTVTNTGHEEMTIEEIMLGKGDYYPGLVPLVYAYLGHIGCDADTMDTVDQVI